MKFSVAPESTSAMASALFAIECMKKRIVIDFRADIYTFGSLVCLIKADLIKQRENPVLLPSLSPTVLFLPWSWQPWRYVLGPGCLFQPLAR